MTLGLVVPRASAEARCQQGLGQKMVLGVYFMYGYSQVQGASRSANITQPVKTRCGRHNASKPHR